MPDPMNLLVTGGAGFIGSHLVRQIIDRPEIARLVNLDALTYAGHEENLGAVVRHPKHAFAKIDLRDAQAVMNLVRREKITHVIHLAAESHVDRSIRGPSDFIHSNILGTFHLLEACRACRLDQPAARGSGSGIRRFLQVSTDEVYGSLGPSGVFTENSRYHPSSPYSASKAAADLLALAHHRTYGLPVIISHCSNNYGPRQFPEKLIPLAIQRLLERRPVPIYGDGLQVREWIHVFDHCEALWRLLVAGRVGHSYHIGGGDERTNLDVIHHLCDAMDELRPDLGGNSRRFITFVDDRPGHDRRYAMDCGKIRQETGWTPIRTFEAGIRETIQWYLDHQDWVRRIRKPAG